MNQVECKHRELPQQGHVKIDGHQDVFVAGTGKLSNAICRLLANDLNPVPFCKAPNHSQTDCPVALFYDGTITYEKANELLDQAYGKVE